jgi:hypothetical protein
VANLAVIGCKYLGLSEVVTMLDDSLKGEGARGSMASRGEICRSDHSACVVADAFESSTQRGIIGAGEKTIFSSRASDELLEGGLIVDHSMRVTLIGMNAGYQARIRLLAAEGLDGWVVGERCDQSVGVSVKFGSPSGGLNLNGFSIKSHELFMCVNTNSDRIDICLFVKTKNSVLRGGVQLPQGGSVMIESAVDRATLIGMSSFGIALY